MIPTKKVHPPSPSVYLSDKVSWKTKKAKNFQWIEIRAAFIDLSYPDCFSQEYKDDVEDNYRLMSGGAMKNFKKKAKERAHLREVSIQQEGLDSPNFETKHFDSLAYMAEGLAGDQQRRLLNYTVTDNSMYTRNYIKDEEDRLITSYFQQSVIEPAKAQIIRNWLQQHGLSDVYEVPADQRQQFQQDVDTQTNALTPREIQRFLKYGSKGRYEEQGQALATAYVKTATEVGLKYLIDDAYKHSLATDAMIFYQGIRRNEPIIEYVDPTRFNTGGTPDIFINNNTWFKRTRHISAWDAWTEFSDDFTDTEKQEFWEALDSFLLGSNGYSKTDEESFVINLDIPGLKEMPTHTMLTREGQSRYDEFFHRYAKSDVEKENIKVVNVVFSSLRKMKEIRRAYEDGSIRYDWHSEEYMFNPVNGDLEERIEWVKEYLTCDRIYIGDKVISTRKGRVDCQFRDVSNPYNVRSPYTGGFFNDLRGKGLRKTRISRCKEYIDQLNFHLRIIREREATDIGKVMLMAINAKPADWSWGKFIDIIRTTRIIPIQTGMGGLTAADVQFFREIDLGNVQDLLHRIGMINFLFAKIADIMSYNSSMQGAAPASTSVTNNMSNINRAQTQTYSYTVWVDKITEMVIQNGIYLTRKCAKGGNIFIRYQLSDLSIATIDVDVDEFDDWKLNVQVTTEQIEIDKLDIARSVIQPFIQASGISLGAAVQSVFAKTRGEFDSIIAEVEMQNEARANHQMQQQVLSQQQMQELEKNLLELKAQLKYQYEVEPTNLAKTEMAALNSLTIQKGNDVNQDGQNDFVEKANEDRRVKERQVENQHIEAMEALAIKREELGLGRESLLIDREGLGIEREKVKVMARKPKGTK